MITFAGIELKNPLVAASSPLTESLRRLECCRDAGFGAAILKSAAPYDPADTRLSSHQRKVVPSGRGYCADGSFKSEIMPLEKAVALYKAALPATEGMFLIPSLYVCAVEPEPWLEACCRFEEAGAKLIQLDFFYLGSVVRETGFARRLRTLLRELTAGLKSTVMPKLNPRFDPEGICRLMAENGVEQVSLLDSIRARRTHVVMLNRTLRPSPRLHPPLTSRFGPHQFPLTLEYLAAAKRHGLLVCAGGGADTPHDFAELRERGAELVQTASFVLRNGYVSVASLLESLGEPAPLSADPASLTHHTWCDIEETGLCSGCGGCKV